MKRWTGTAVAIAVLALAAGACTNKTEAATTAVGIKRAAAGQTPFPINIDPATFGADSARITNEWWPLKPGAQWTWEGHALDGQDYVRRKLILTVTDFTKRIAGVNVRVLWERDYNNNKLAESELSFVAQDKSGAVWLFGETVEKYDEEGTLDGAHTWLMGYLEGAKAGMMIPGKPRVNMPSWPEGFAPAPFNWDDVARVSQALKKDCVRAGCFSNVIVIEKSEPNKPDAFQLKFWAKGVGNIRTDWRGRRELDKEELELVKREMVGKAVLAKAHAEAMRIDARQRVYGLTENLERPA